MYQVFAKNSEGKEKYSVSLMVKEQERVVNKDFRDVLKPRFVEKIISN